MTDKNIRTKRTITILAGLIVLVGVVFGTLYIMVRVNLDQAVLVPRGMSAYIDRGDYDIDPKTIIDSLNHGEADVFKPMSATPAAYNTPYPAGSFPWHQSDYLQVASALHQFVWKETLEDWRLFSMDFSRGCQDNPSGFDSAEITYFKVVDGSLSYVAHGMDIYPTGSGVSWGAGTFPRPSFGWKSIDLRGLKVNADGALQMAENNGGKAARLQVKNVCAIDVLLKPNGDVSDWIVFYDNVGSIIFEITIDPYTGKFKVLPSR